jgi:para-nitrobenzyl esterase
LRTVVSIGAVAAAVVALAAVALTAAASAASSQAAAQPACTAGTLVHTKDGPVCGTTTDGVTSYLGIRYAAPPVGRLRWRPPQPVTPWTSVYQATEHGTSCPSPFLPASETSEDCLFLDVMVPAGTRPGERLPVMYEIHGGGFIGEAPTDNGQNLVTGGRVIYVYVGYRIGILGFMANAGLGPHSGDYGLQDQQAGLRWVKQNIAHFGGNPHKVTIFGESAGGASVCDQVASPTAAGLFQSGISISGFYNFNVNTIWWPADCKSKLQTEAQAQQEGAQFAAKVGCGTATNVIACMRALPAATLVADAAQVFDPTGGGTIGPIVNGTTLTMSAGAAFKLGKVNNVKLMIGVGRDEFNGGAYTNSPGATVVATTAAQYRQLVKQQFGQLAPTVERLYPIARYPAPAPFIAYRTIMADAFSVCPALVVDRQASKAIPVYAYEDDDADNPTETEPGAHTQPLGALHSGINGIVHADTSSLDANQAAFQDQVIAQWTGLARTGNPTARKAPRWTRYTARNRLVMSEVPAGDSALVPTSTLAAQHNCGFWDVVNRTAPWAP